MTPLQQELGIDRYEQLADAWMRRRVYQLQGMQFVPQSVPDSYFRERRERDDELSATTSLDAVAALLAARR